MLVQDDDVQETVREKNVLNTGSWLQCTALLCQAECAPDAVPGKPGQWPRARFPARNIRNPCSLSWYHGQRARREETLTTGYHGAWQRAPVTRQHLQKWSSTPAARHRPAIIREARYRVASTQLHAAQCGLFLAISFMCKHFNSPFTDRCSLCHSLHCILTWRGQSDLQC